MTNRLVAVVADGTASEIPLEIERVVDPEQISARFATYLQDESKSVAPGVKSISFPKNTEEVSHVLRHHSQLNEPTTISGARTGIVGGAVPDIQSHLVSLEKIKFISPVYKNEQGETQINVGAGVTLHDLNEHLAENERGLFFPVDPTETWASIGGMVSTNASGARSYFYGSTGRWVNGLTVVLANGSVLRIKRGEVQTVGNRLILECANKNTLSTDSRELSAASLAKPLTKHTVGYTYGANCDAVDIFVGAEGTLGAVTEIELKLAEIPQIVLSYLQLFRDESCALAFVRALRETKELKTLAIEYCDKRAISLANESPIKSTSPVLRLVKEDTAAAVYCEVELADENDLEVAFDKISTIVGDVGADFADSFAGTEDRELRELKAFRHAVPERINNLIAQRKVEHPSLHKVATDMAVPDQFLEEMYQLYRKALDGRGLDYAIFGHAGNNHFHVNMLPRNAAELAEGKSVYMEFAREAVARGGAVSAEHGLGKIKKEMLKVQYSAKDIATMWEIKRFFDPHLLLNQGVLLPQL